VQEFGKQILVESGCQKKIDVQLLLVICLITRFFMEVVQEWDLFSLTA